MIHYDISWVRQGNQTCLIKFHGHPNFKKRPQQSYSGTRATEVTKKLQNVLQGFKEIAMGDADGARVALEPILFV